MALHAPILFYKSKFKTATESDAHSLSLLSCDVCLNKSIFKIRIWNWNLSLSLKFQIASKQKMSSSPKSKSESLHLISPPPPLLLEESNSDPVPSPSSPKVNNNNNNVAKKTTLIMQCEVVRRRSPRLSPSPSPSQGFRRSPRLISDGGSLGKSEKSLPPPPPPRRRSSSSTSRFASPQNARSTDRLKVWFWYFYYEMKWDTLFTHSLTLDR